MGCSRGFCSVLKSPALLMLLNGRAFNNVGEVRSGQLEQHKQDEQEDAESWGFVECENLSDNIIALFLQALKQKMKHPHPPALT